MRMKLSFLLTGVLTLGIAALPQGSPTTGEAPTTFLSNDKRQNIIINCGHAWNKPHLFGEYAVNLLRSTNHWIPKRPLLSLQVFSECVCEVYRYVNCPYAACSWDVLFIGNREASCQGESMKLTNTTLETLAWPVKCYTCPWITIPIQPKRNVEEEEVDAVAISHTAPDTAVGLFPVQSDDGGQVLADPVPCGLGHYEKGFRGEFYTFDTMGAYHDLNRPVLSVQISTGCTCYTFE